MLTSADLRLKGDIFYSGSVNLWTASPAFDSHVVPDTTDWLLPITGPLILLLAPRLRFWVIGIFSGLGIFFSDGYQKGTFWMGF